MKKILLLIYALIVWQLVDAQNNDFAADLQLCEYFVNNGKQSQAYTTLNNIINVDKRNHQAFWIRARAYHVDGNQKSALYDVQQALKFSPLNSNYLALEGEIFSDLKQHSKAAESYNRAAKCDTINRINIYNAAYQYMKAKSYSKALQLSRQYQEYFPESDSAKALTAEILVESDNAVDALQIINSLNVKGLTFYRLRGIAYCKSEMYDYAIKDLTQAIDINPQDGNNYIWRGLSYYKKGNRKQAHNDWETAIKKGDYSAKDYIDRYR